MTESSLAGLGLIDGDANRGAVLLLIVYRQRERRRTLVMPRVRADA
jgi:hypothetical protein